jgi:glycosyltransferase involved in cell wall biosynthesis
MRLLILNYEYPPLGGGAGVCAQYHAKGLEKLGHQVTVITTWFGGEEKQENQGNLTLIRLKSRRKKKYRSNPLEMLSWAIQAYRYILKSCMYKQVDLVMAHFAIPGGLVALPLKFRFKLPYMIVSHGQDIPWFCPRELFFYHLLFYLPIMFICRNAEKITVLSGKRLGDARSLVGRAHFNKLHIVPNGCDTEFFSPCPEMKEKNVLDLIVVGRLTHQKAPFTILWAMKSLNQESIPFRLTIIGNGPLQNAMVRFVRVHQLEGKVAFAGWISKMELRTYYRQSHIMLVGSSDEGMSLAILEALSTGLYIIATRVSGSDKYITEGLNGDLIPVNDAVSLAEKIETYYREKFLCNYSIPVSVLNQVRKNVSWDTVVETYNNLLK